MLNFRRWMRGVEKPTLQSKICLCLVCYLCVRCNFVINHVLALVTVEELFHLATCPNSVRLGISNRDSYLSLVRLCCHRENAAPGLPEYFGVWTFETRHSVCFFVLLFWESVCPHDRTGRLENRLGDEVTLLILLDNQSFCLRTESRRWVG